MKNFCLKYSWLPVLVLLSSCWKEPVYPKEPQISFKSITARTFFEPKNETDVVELKMTVNFKDGDGDLGLRGTAQDSLPPYNFDEGRNPYFYNFFVESYIEQNGEFVKANLPIQLNGRYPLLNPDGQVRALEGELTFSPSFIAAFLPLDFQSGDRMKFTIRIVDRALHESNIVETDPVQIFFN